MRNLFVLALTLVVAAIGMRAGLLAEAPARQQPTGGTIGTVAVVGAATAVTIIAVQATKNDASGSR
jgi:hypothetical protein